MSKDMESGIGRQESSEVKIFGITVYSRRKEEHFDVRKLPEPVRRGLRESRIAPEDQEAVLAVVGRAYGRLGDTWSDRLSDAPELTWRVPSPPDFEATLKNIRGKVSKGDLVALSKKLFGQTDTPPELICSLEREFEIMFDRSNDK